MLPSPSGGADRVQQLTVRTLLQHICGDTSTKELVQVGLVSMASEYRRFQFPAGYLGERGPRPGRSIPASTNP